MANYMKKQFQNTDLQNLPRHIEENTSPTIRYANSDMQNGGVVLSLMRQLCNQKNWVRVLNTAYQCENYFHPRGDWKLVFLGGDEWENVFVKDASQLLLPWPQNRE